MQRDDRWEKILDGVAEYLETAPVEEILADVRVEGGDPDAIAEEVRVTLNQATRPFQRRHLARARRDYEAEVSASKQRVFKLPPTPARRRNLLQSLTGNLGLTLQNRDITELSDEDVEIQLQSLAELGALDNRDEANGEE